MPPEAFCAVALTVTFPFSEFTIVLSDILALTVLFRTSTFIDPPTAALPLPARVPPLVTISVLSYAITSSPFDVIFPLTSASVLLTITFAPMLAADANFPVEIAAATGIKLIFS